MQINKNGSVNRTEMNNGLNLENGYYAPSNRAENRVFTTSSQQIVNVPAQRAIDLSQNIPKNNVSSIHSSTQNNLYVQDISQSYSANNLNYNKVQQDTSLRNKILPNSRMSSEIITPTKPYSQNIYQERSFSPQVKSF